MVALVSAEGEGKRLEDRKSPPPSLPSFPSPAAAVTLNSGFRFFHSKREDFSKNEEDDFTIERWPDGRTDDEIASADHKSTRSDESVPPPRCLPALSADACRLSCSCSKPNTVKCKWKEWHM